jgi:hypothetical protein
MYLRPTLKEPDIMNRKGVWIRIAGNARNIKEEKAMHWRCYINDINEEEPISRWFVDGIVNNTNFIARTNSKRDKNGLIAWIDLYGDIVIDADRNAYITLRLPQ